MPKQSAKPAHVCSARMLLECVQLADSADHEELRQDARSLRSWLVFKLKFRTIEIPHELAASYERLLHYYSEEKV